ncbi:MAG: metallophosphoesterase [Planctomycetota bacterium]
MRLLLFSDLHCSISAAARLVELAARADVLIGAGDFANVRRGIEDTISILAEGVTTKPVVLVPGNNETLDELVAATADWPNATVLHGNGATLLDTPFFGIGGGIPVTPFGDWSFDFSNEQADELLADCPAGAVLVSHSPPKGTLDVSSSGKSIGSYAVQRAIDRTRPRLVVCGHIHHSGGQHARVPRSHVPVVNAGPAGILWDLAVDAPIAMA